MIQRQILYNYYILLIGNYQSIIIFQTKKVYLRNVNLKTNGTIKLNNLVLNFMFGISFKIKLI